MLKREIICQLADLILIMSVKVNHLTIKLIIISGNNEELTNLRKDVAELKNEVEKLKNQQKVTEAKSQSNTIFSTTKD